MKIKSGEWKHVYKRNKERIKDDCLGGERRSGSLTIYGSSGNSTVFGPPSGIASAKLDPHDGRQTADSTIFRWSRGQHTKPLSLNSEVKVSIFIVKAIPSTSCRKSHILREYSSILPLGT